MRLVLDTNIIVSAIAFPRSKPRQVLERAQSRDVILVSRATFLELERVLMRSKFERYVSQTKREAFLIGFSGLVEMVRVTESIDACRDPKDNKFLEAAIAGNANVIITGDDDLLTLDPFREVKILTASAFLQQVG